MFDDGIVWITAVGTFDGTSDLATITALEVKTGNTVTKFEFGAN